MHTSPSPGALKSPTLACIAGALLGVVFVAPIAGAQSLDRKSIVEPAAAPARVLVSDEGVESSYGAPASFSRSRFANLTNAYVLPPFAVYAGLIYEGDALRYDHPDHLFTQEIEVGLPHRFGVAIENGQEVYRNRGQETSTSFELRYALADWDKIPLNPTVFVEYRKGNGHIFHDEGVPMRAGKGEDDADVEEKEEDADADEKGGGRPHIPDAVEFRVLLAHDFHEKLEWAMNMFFELEVQGDRGREWGFAQSFLAPVLLPREQLKVGLEMQYSNFTDKDTRGDAANRFILGPTIAFKPTRNTRIDVSPLFGVTFDAPRVQAFGVFSYTFGPGGEANEAEAPASTRNR